MVQPMKVPDLTVRSIHAVGVEVPMTYALGTSRGHIAKAPLLLIDVETAEGVTGRAYLWAYFRQAMPAIACILQAIKERARGERIVPAELWGKLAERFALIGVQGIVRMAMAGFDVACWDALAVAAGVPLVKLIGAEPRRIPAYNSCGLGLMPEDALADEAEKLLAGGFRAIKLRLGYPTLADDLAAVHAVKRRIPADVALMVDYNQALGIEEALARGRALDRESIAWLEEPIRHDDYAGAAMLAREAYGADSDRREFFSHRRNAGGARCRRLRSGDAGPRTHRRRHRLAACHGAGGRAQHQDVVAPLPGGERASAGGDADRPFPRIRRLGRQDCAGPAADRGRRGRHFRPARQRRRLERSRRRALSGVNRRGAVSVA